VRTIGFLFDTSPVASQFAAIQNVLSQYQDGLEFGILDPEVELPNMIQALKDAGVDEFIAEKQRQLDEWVANNK
jgi:putative aldouronate transport system substrate-binding protein